MNGIHAGCPGGAGGSGGNGGHGAGGRGGHSIAIAAVGFTYVRIDGPTELQHGTPGLGGFGGDESMPEQNAFPGTGSLIEPLDP